MFRSTCRVEEEHVLSDNGLKERLLDSRHEPHFRDGRAPVRGQSVQDRYELR